MVELHAGNYDKAIDFLQQSIAMDANSAAAYFELGKAYGRKAQSSSIFSALGLAKQCVENFEKAYMLNSSSKEILQSLVEFHSMAPSIAGGSSEKFYQYISALEKLSPDMAKMYEIKRLEKDKKSDQALVLARELKQKTNMPVVTQFMLGLYFKEGKFYADSEDVL